MRSAQKHQADVQRQNEAHIGSCVSSGLSRVPCLQSPGLPGPGDAPAGPEQRLPHGLQLRLLRDVRDAVRAHRE